LPKPPDEYMQTRRGELRSAVDARTECLER
jgi:hypothetical protein